MSLAPEKITDFDGEFLHIVSRANLNLVNLPKVAINLNKWQPEEYDFIREVVDEQKGIPPRN